jgi:hypothetical protein
MLLPNDKLAEIILNNPKFRIKKENTIKVGIDFDDTLTDFSIFSYIKSLIELHEDKIDWWIFTSRFGIHGIHWSIEKSNGIDSNDIALISKWLGLFNSDKEEHKVIFTNHKCKSDLIDEFQFDLHLNNNLDEQHPNIVHSIGEFNKRLSILLNSCNLIHKE